MTAATTPRSLALAAAHAAVEASTELLLFAREGDDDELFEPDNSYPVEPVEKLTDALKMTLEAMGEAGSADEHGQLLAACSKFLDGWVP